MKKHLNVIMVEDNEDDAILVQRELSRNYRLESVRVDTAEGLIELLSDHKWEIVIADYAMPQFSGLEALRIVKELTTDLPFIIVSGTIGEETAVAAMRAGAQDFIMKDRLARLLPAIERELREAQEHKKRRQVETALRKSEEQNRDLIESMTEGLALKDEKNRLVMVNDRLCEMLGYPRQELLDNKITKFLDKENEKIFKTKSGNAKAGKRHAFELTWQRSDGSKLMTIVSTVSLNNSVDSMGRSIAVITDITEQKKNEEKLLEMTRELELERKSLTEKNVALKHVLEHIQQEKNEFKENLLGEINYQLVQATEKAKREEDDGTLKQITKLAGNLNALLSRGTDEFRERLMSLSPRETQICTLIREGLSSKEISDSLSLSLLTVNKHREQIRKKLLIKNKSVNLNTYLRTRYLQQA